MVESAPEVHPISSEAQKLDRVVSLFSRAGYHYELRATHEDPDGDMHFRKELLNKFYPHFHLIYQPTKDVIKIHLDERRHVVRKVSEAVSNETDRLIGFFQIWSQSANVDFASYSDTFKKQLVEASLFKHAKFLQRGIGAERRNIKETRQNKHNKLRKETKGLYKQKKYAQQESEEVWHIAYWEPIEDELKRLANRQDQDKPDTI